MNKINSKLSGVIIVLTMMFKIFIMATVLTTFIELNSLIFVMLTVAGIVWVLGFQTINTLVYLFKKN